MRLMLLKKELDHLVRFVGKTAKTLGIDKQDIKKIELKTAAIMSLTVPSDTSQLELIRQTTREVASFLDCFPKELDEIGLAIDEACSNVIMHSYTQSQKGSIVVEFSLSQDKLEILLIDNGVNGQFFNPDHISPVDMEKCMKELSRGGLGVHLIKKIMNEVEYTVSPGHRNCLKMVKYTTRNKRQ
jgi:serine/threonine-protein kinase RsbW